MTPLRTIAKAFCLLLLLISCMPNTSVGNTSWNSYTLSETHSSSTVQVDRKIKQVADYEYIIEVKLLKQGIDGVAKLTENVPEGFDAKLVQSTNGIFTFKDGVVKVIWMKVPQGESLTVVYKINGRKVPTGLYKISGSFSARNKGQQIRSSVPSSEFEFKNAEQELLAAQIRKREAEAKAKLEEQQFNQLLLKGDDELQAANFDQSIATYRRASAMRPNNQRAKDKIKTANLRKKMAAEAEAKRIAKRKSFDEMMAKAERFFEAKEYASAKGTFENAASIIPSDPQPAERILEIESILKKQRAEELALQQAEQDRKLKQELLNQDFERLVAQADGQRDVKSYDEALKVYAEARKLKPNDEKLIEKIENTRLLQRKALAEEAAKRRKFEQRLIEGREQFDNSQYADALRTFNSAETLFPNHPEALEEIQRTRDALKKAEAAKLAELEAEKAAKRSQFDEYMAEGTARKENQSLEQALASYQAAKALFPSDAEANAQIGEIERLITEKKEKEEQARLKAERDAQFESERKEKEFQELMARAEGQSAQQAYGEALKIYEDALSYKPKDSKLLGTIERTKELHAVQLAEQKARKDKFDRLMEKGKAHISAKNYEDALRSFNSAEEVFPKDAKAIEQIQRTRDLINAREEEKVAKQAADNQRRRGLFDQHIAEAEGFKTQEKYNNAMSAYKKAEALFPADDEVLNAIAELEALIKQQEADELAARQAAAEQKTKDLAIERDYQQSMGRGDNWSDKRNYREALTWYRKALTIKPGAEEPQKRIAELEEKLIAQTLAEEKKTNPQPQPTTQPTTRSITTNPSNAGTTASVGNTNNAAVTPERREEHTEEELLDLIAVAAEEDERREKYEMEQARLLEEQFGKLMNQGEANIAERDYRSAIVSYELAHDLKPEDEEVLRRLQEAQSLKKEATEIEIGKDIRFANYMEEGKANFNLFNFEKAVESYKKALEIQPGSKEARARMLEAQQHWDGWKNLSDEEQSQRAEDIFEEKKMAEAEWALKKGLVYKVQLASSSTKQSPDYFSSNYNISEPVEAAKDKGSYKYYAGHFRNYEEAQTYKAQIKDKGVEGAFLVAFFNGTKVTLDQAKVLEKAK